MRISTFIVLVCIVSGITVLSGLGLWQLDRLEWKEALIAKVDKNLSSEPTTVKLALVEAEKDSSLGVDYRPVRLSGQFVDTKPIYEFTTFDRQSGWNIYSLLKLSLSDKVSDKQYAVINRGFVPFDKRDEFEQTSVPQGEIELEGLLRATPLKQPSAAFDNDVIKRTFYWRDVEAMTKVWNHNSEAELTWYVDQGIPNKSYDKTNYPKPGTTLINFPNSHLQYAFTWFGIAFALLGVGSYFLYSRRKEN